MTLYELSRAVGEMKRGRRYGDALALFKKEKENFSKNEIAGNEYLVADMLTILRKSGEASWAYEFLNRYGIGIGAEAPERILCAFGWVLYDDYKARAESGALDRGAFLEQIRRLVPLLQNYNSDYAKSVLSSLFRIVVRTEKRKPSPSWEFLERFSACFDPEYLSTECRVTEMERRGRVREVELASDRENWYAVRSKALYQTGKMRECFEISREALEVLDRFHFNNELWFARRMALALSALGDTESAIEELERVAAKKREWFVLKELAGLYRQKGDAGRAYELAMEAMNAPGELEYKVGVLELLGGLLQERGEESGAAAHRGLALAIRRRMEWKVPKELAAQAGDGPIDEERLRKGLERYWKKWRMAQSRKGVIVRILHDNERGVDGFLRSGEEEFYFRIPSHHRLAGKLAEEARVAFEAEEGPHGKPRARLLGLAA